MAQIQSLYLGKAGNYSGEMRDTQQESKWEKEAKLKRPQRLSANHNIS
jgi:hypothetical protein